VRTREIASTPTYRYHADYYVSSPFDSDETFKKDVLDAQTPAVVVFYTEGDSDYTYMVPEFEA